MTGSLFGNRFYGAILGVVNIFFAAGYAFGAVIFGVIVDISGGSYTAAWIAMTAAGGISYVLLLIAANYFIKNAESKKRE